MIAWPPVSAGDWVLVIMVSMVAFVLFYTITRVITFGVFKSFFEARRHHYNKLKEEVKKWKNEDQGK